MAILGSGPSDGPTLPTIGKEDVFAVDQAADLSFEQPIVDVEASGDGVIQKILSAPSRANLSLQRTAISLQYEPFHYAKRSLEAAVVTYDVLPLNELTRYAIFFAARSATNGNALASGAAFGLASFATEAAAAVATSNLLDSDGGKALIQRITRKSVKKVDGVEYRDLSVPTKVATAMLGGVAPLLAWQTHRNPERTLVQNRRTGLKVAGIMGAYFAVEGVVTSEIIETQGIFKAAGVIAVGLTVANIGVNKLSARQERKLINRSYDEYEDYRSKNNRALRVGIFGEDITTAIKNPGTITLDYKNSKGKDVTVPALVPVELLEWFSADVVKAKYGSDAKILCYVHPPTPTPETRAKIQEMLDKKIADGYIIITEKYFDDTDSPIAAFLESAKENDEKYAMEYFGDEQLPSTVDFFTGIVDVGHESGSHIVDTSSLSDVYNKAIQDGEIAFDGQNGAGLVTIIDEDVSEEIWDIYKRPFDELGANDPTQAGFTKRMLLEILKDPSIAKIVNRVDGDITTLLIFLQDFEKAPWFNKAYYEKYYNRYVKTNNVLMFPGIVSDDTKRGNNYAMKVIDLAAELIKKRGSDMLITFECTQISTAYIPKIVTAAVGNNGLVSVSGLEERIGGIEYFGISSAQQD